MNQFSIKIKVLLILLLLTIIMIVGMALSMNSGFNKGFFNYRKAMDEQFNTNLIAELSTSYQDHGNWKHLYDNRRLWHDLINQSSIEEDKFRDHRPPPPQHRKGAGNNRPPRNHKQQNNKRPPKRHGDFGKRKPGPRRLLPPVNLFDHDKAFIIGMDHWQGQELIYKEIKIDNAVVGYLATIKNNVSRQLQDQIFEKSIKQMLLKMGLLMIIVAIAIAFPVAKYFTELINKITHATKLMAAGDYSKRIESNRKDELGELATHFNLLAQSLESNSGSQKTMIADIAHELRTPISVIVSEIEAIQDGVHQANENTLGLLHSQISSLKNLVNDLHELSESDLGSLKYTMQEFDLLNLIQDCHQNFQFKFSQKKINLDFITHVKNCTIMGDMNRLNQLFNNILNNSFLYTNAGGKALIELTCHSNEIELSFSDSAPGLNAEQLTKIFDRWYRVEKSRNKQSGGSGLGLSICKQIVNAHNGQINATQSGLGGITITIKITKTYSYAK